MKTVLIKFQFQYGTIRSLSSQSREVKDEYFNSSMVRLEVIYPITASLKRLISIPVWYDQKKKECLNIQTLPKFQFQYGTIRRIKDFKEITGIKIFQFQYGTIRRLLLKIYLYCVPYFNSSMVRLEGVYASNKLQQCIISIPVWYDQKYMVDGIG